MLSLDVIGDMYYSEGRALHTKKDYQELAENLAHAFKNKELFFSSFATKNNLERFIIKYTSLIN
ncbi:hypothetical protein [Clostridium sp.]|uniref:hypothetical protein n=1 Tax=Clostridium sp. TaxID=1506 RepID=UPI0026279F7C|nr:hypothetical protein [Clostridium sp.]